MYLTGTGCQQRTQTDESRTRDLLSRRHAWDIFHSGAEFNPPLPPGHLAWAALSLISSHITSVIEDMKEAAAPQALLVRIVAQGRLSHRRSTSSVSPLTQRQPLSVTQLDESHYCR